jgi:LPXTG-site transpeptidase (sortase) family protein
MKKKDNNLYIIYLGVVFFLLSFFILYYDKFQLIKSEVYDEISFQKYLENININKSFEENKVIDNNNDRNDELDEEDDIEITIDDNKTKLVNKTSNDYIGFLEIKKINIMLGFYDKDSKNNDLSKNIKVLPVSKYPDATRGNVIIAGHSGTGRIAFFKNFYKLSKGDKATIYYKGKKYDYVLNDIYDVPKTGSVKLKKIETNKNLILITCTYQNKKMQSVYVFKLISEGDSNE